MAANLFCKRGVGGLKWGMKKAGARDEGEGDQGEPSTGRRGDGRGGTWGRRVWIPRGGEEEARVCGIRIAR